MRFNSFDSVPLSTLHSQFCDITKGIILQKFLQTKIRDSQLVAMSNLAITKSENLIIVTGTCKPRLPVLIYSTPFVMLQNCEKKAGLPIVLVKRIKTYFREQEEFGNVEKGLVHLFISTSSSYFFNKPI